VALVAGLGFVLWGTVGADARSAFGVDLPNGLVHDCDACHIDINAALNLTWFGADVALAYDDYRDPRVHWDRVYSLDSDRDGQTNGEELGDPCGVWLRGTDPQYEEVSNPGSASSLLESVPPHECDDAADDDDSADVPLTNCVYSLAGPTTSDHGGLVGLGLLSWLVIRRTCRRRPRP